MMDLLDETKALIVSTTGALNFVGGDFDIKKVSNLPFSEVIDHLISNGVNISLSIENKRHFKKDWE